MMTKYLSRLTGRSLRASRFVLAGAVWAVASTLAATSVIPISDAELYRRADVVVHGIVVSSDMIVNGRGWPETVTVIEPLSVLKGTLRGSLVLHQLGGKLPDGRFFKMWGRPEYVPGREVVVFAIARPDGEHETAEMLLGKFEVRKDEAGVHFAVPQLANGVHPGVDVHAGPDGRIRSAVATSLQRATAVRRLDHFLDALRRGVFTERVVAATVGRMTPITHEERVSRAPVPLWSNIGDVFFRWNNGATAVWTLSGAANVDGGGVAEATNALASWTDDANSDINYTLGSETTNIISLNATSSALGCGWSTCLSGGGVIGCGGPVGEGTHDWRGDTYNSITGGTVELRAYCTHNGFDSITTQSVLTHQLGHTLGLGHSDQNASITWFTAARSTVTVGSSTTLTPTYVNETSASIDNGVGDVTSGSPYTVTPLSTTTYILTVNGPGGPVTAAATVLVVPAASIVAFTASPASIAIGASCQLTATFNGGTASIDHGIGSMTTGVPVSTGPLAASTTYTLTVTNTAGDSVMGTSTVTVNAVPPAIGYGSASYTFTTGAAIAPLTATNGGGAVVTWSINPPLPAGLAFSTANGSISGTPSLVTPATGYTVTASNTGGTSSVTPIITVNPPAPTITVQPASQTVDIGATPVFGVTASGTGPLSYQWSRDTTPIGGATSSSYVTPAVVLADSGAVFAVAVSDAYGSSVASAAATLTVLPDLATWLNVHPNVAGAIKWQFQPANMANSYAAPAETDKVAWPAWTQAQKDGLNQAYLDARTWFAQGAQQVSMPYGGLSDQPANQNFQSATDGITVSEWVTPAYMWKLYVAHVGFSLALEIANPLPWSITGDSDESLRYLFDSSVMAWYLPNGSFGMGTYGGANFPPLRANNRPQTAFAPPVWTYAFLTQAGLVGATRLETIGKVMDWMRHNMAHFYGNDSFGNYNAVWQYRGYAPLSKIVNGTIDNNNPASGLQHWTAGCHGSVGFLHAVLRAVNIPVQPVWVAGHELAYFTTEKAYLDHGDDPYNNIVKSFPASPILSLLIDQATYQSWFTPDLTINITDPYSPALANVGRRAAEFH
jgi:hypothetical protein